MGLFGKKAKKEAPAQAHVLEQYSDRYPGNDVAIDIFKDEWTSRFPAEAGVVAGTTPLFDDPRVKWAMETIGSPKGKTVLELGFLEGGHSYMLDRMGAASVTAIDANTHAYLKALIAKEILGMPSVKLFCGDFTQYLQPRDKKFDILLCSGVLYHMTDPVRLLADMAACSDNLYIWTHYFDRDIIQASAESAHHFNWKKSTCKSDDFSATVYRREYLDSLGWGGFCGGTTDHCYWMKREDIVACLEHFGFNHFEYDFEEKDHPSGPSVAMVAQRR